MKTHSILPVLLAAGTAVASVQTLAAGMTYDPYDDYYSEYYGAGSEFKATQVQAEAPLFSENDDTHQNKHVAVVTSTDQDDMADPGNYYNW